MSVPKLYETTRPQRTGPESPTEPRFFARRGIKSHDTPRGPADSDTRVPVIRPALTHAEPRISSLYKRKSAAAEAKDREITAAKLRPARIRQDKEQLYEDSLALKMENNGLRNENLRLRTRLNQLEKDLARKDDFLEELRGLSEERQFSSVLAHSHLVAGLKQANRDLRIELASKETEFEKLKRLSKLTKLNEMETELKVYVEECQRLKDCLLDSGPQGPQDSALQSQLFEAKQEAERLRRHGLELEAQIKTQDSAEQQLAVAQGEVEDLLRQLSDLEQRKEAAIQEYANEMEELYKQRSTGQATAKKVQLLLEHKETALSEALGKIQALEYEIEEERGEKEKIAAQISALNTDIVEKGDLLRVVLLKMLKRKLEHAGISPYQALTDVKFTIPEVKSAFKAQGINIKAWQLQALASIMSLESLSEELERVEVRAKRKIKAERETIREIEPPKPVLSLYIGEQVTIRAVFRRKSSDSSKHSRKSGKKSSSSSRKSSISDHEAFATAVKVSDPLTIKTEKDLFRTNVDMSLSPKSSNSSNPEPGRDQITPFEAESPKETQQYQAQALTPPPEEVKAYLDEPDIGPAQGSSIDDLNERVDESISIPVIEAADLPPATERIPEATLERESELSEGVDEGNMRVEEEKAGFEEGFPLVEREEQQESASPKPEIGTFPLETYEEKAEFDEVLPSAEPEMRETPKSSPSQHELEEGEFSPVEQEEIAPAEESQTSLIADFPAENPPLAVDSEGSGPKEVIFPTDLPEAHSPTTKEQPVLEDYEGNMPIEHEEYVVAVEKETTPPVPEPSISPIPAETTPAEPQIRQSQEGLETPRQFTDLLPVSAPMESSFSRLSKPASFAPPPSDFEPSVPDPIPAYVQPVETTTVPEPIPAYVQPVETTTAPEPIPAYVQPVETTTVPEHIPAYVQPVETTTAPEHIPAYVQPIETTAAPMPPLHEESGWESSQFSSEIPHIPTKTLSDLPSPQAEKALKRMRLSLLSHGIGKSQLSDVFLAIHPANSILVEADLEAILSVDPFNITEELPALLSRLVNKCQNYGEALNLLNEDLPHWEILSKTQEDIRNQQLLQLFTHAPDLVAAGEITSDWVSLDSFEILMLKYGFRIDSALRGYIEYLSFLETRQLDCVPYQQLKHAYTTQQSELTASAQAIAWSFSGSHAEALAKECALLLSNRLIELNTTLRTAFQAKLKEEMTLAELEIGLKALGMEENCGEQSQALVGESGRISVARLEALLVHFGAHPQAEKGE